MIDAAFLWETLLRLLPGLPLTLQLAAISLLIGALLAFALAGMRLSGLRLLDGAAQAYILVFRGTPLLVQIYLIYYGAAQFPALRDSMLWPFLREAWWCAVLALSLNTGAYGAEIVRGGLMAVPGGQIEAAQACGMGRALMFRRVLLPQALVRMLPAYGNEIVLMIKATALASTITLMEITGLAAKAISESYRPVEVFLAAAALYLCLTLGAGRLVRLAEMRLLRGQGNTGGTQS